MKAYAKRFLARSQDREDVVQEAFKKALEARHLQKTDVSASYVYRTIRNLSLNHLQKAETKHAVTGDNLDYFEFHQSELDELLNSHRQLEKVAAVVQKLPPKCQQVFVMKKVYGYTNKEIAARLKVSIKTVESHMTKAIILCGESLSSSNKKAAHCDTVHTHKSANRF